MFDRVRETSTTTGTGTLTLAGAVTGFRTFSAAFGNGVKCYYVIEGGSEWEVGIGTTGAGTLARDVVLANSNGNTNPVNFSAGTKTVFCDVPSDFLKNQIKVNTDGATVTFDLAAISKHQVTLGGNRTLALSNAHVGQFFMIKLIQDGTGSRTVTWFTTIKWANGSTPILTTTANKADWFGFVCTSSGNYDGFIIAQNV